jgi:NAD-dependent dihydropyrimidine dehydrogenase PreA subunit
MSYYITDPCIGTKDTACVDVCPVDCIHPRKDEEAFPAATILFIDPVECIDCGACVPACPVQAIYAADDLPESQRAFVQINEVWYKEPTEAEKLIGEYVTSTPDQMALDPQDRAAVHGK